MTDRTPEAQAAFEALAEHERYVWLRERMDRFLTAEAARKITVRGYAACLKRIADEAYARDLRMVRGMRRAAGMMSHA